MCLAQLAVLEYGTLAHLQPWAISAAQQTAIQSAPAQFNSDALLQGRVLLACCKLGVCKTACAFAPHQKNLCTVPHASCYRPSRSWHHTTTDYKPYPHACHRRLLTSALGTKIFSAQIQIATDDKRWINRLQQMTSARSVACNRRQALDQYIATTDRKGNNRQKSARSIHCNNRTYEKGKRGEANGERQAGRCKRSYRLRALRGAAH